MAKTLKIHGVEKTQALTQIQYAKGFMQMPCFADRCDIMNLDVKSTWLHKAS